MPRPDLCTLTVFSARQNKSCEALQTCLSCCLLRQAQYTDQHIANFKNESRESVVCGVSHLLFHVFSSEAMHVHGVTFRVSP